MPTTSTPKTKGNMSNPFQKATKAEGSYARVAIQGPAGCGKTFSALLLASSFGKVAMIDTEFGSARKYSDVFDFDVVELHGNYTTANLIQSIEAAVANQYNCLIVDSFSHFWEGDKGILEQADIASEKMGGNTMRGWSVASPQWRKQMAALLGAPIHIIVCMRTKNNFEMSQDERGRMKVQVVGTKPVQRDGIDYELECAV